MACRKIRRSKRCKRTQPPRLVHAVQRPGQPSVTADVAQITETVAFIWTVDISPPPVTRAAFPLGPPLVACGGPFGAHPGRIGQPRTHSPPGGPALLRAGRRDRPGGERRHGVGLRPRGPAADPGGFTGRWSAGGIDRDGTVTAAIPRATELRPGPGPGSGPARPGRRRRPSGTRCRVVHQFQLRTAHSSRSISSPRDDADVAFTSSSCARGSPF